MLTVSNKALRILIADEQHFHRMKIERLFNQLDYYRIAPVRTLNEMLNLTEYGCEPFDLVLINAALADAALDLRGFFRNHPGVRHAWVYNAGEAFLAVAQDRERGSLEFSQSTLPEIALIRQLMRRVDPLLTPHYLAQRSLC